MRPAVEVGPRGHAGAMSRAADGIDDSDDDYPLSRAVNDTTPNDLRDMQGLCVENDAGPIVDRADDAHQVTWCGVQRWCVNSGGERYVWGGWSRDRGWSYVLVQGTLNVLAAAAEAGVQVC
jgi:nucleoside-diphosphate-sugar epimerase